MKIVKASETRIKETTHIVDASDVYNASSLQVVYIELKPGESSKSRKSSSIFFVIKVS